MSGLLATAAPPPDTIIPPPVLSWIRWQATTAQPQKGQIMATKATKAKKSAKAKKATKSTHVPTPWAKLRQMWEAGASYEAMAEATDAHYDPQKPDPTKPTRAKIWKARNVGVNIDGKLIKFGARGKAKEQGKKGKAEKGKKAAGKGKAGKNAGKATKTAAKSATPVEPKAEPSSSTESATKGTSA